MNYKWIPLNEDWLGSDAGEPFGWILMCAKHETGLRPPCKCDPPKEVWDKINFLDQMNKI